jgi:peptidoglycan hydrolase-like protein with peptidoglycan-binding domain
MPGKYRVPTSSHSQRRVRRRSRRDAEETAEAPLISNTKPNHVLSALPARSATHILRQEAVLEMQQNLGNGYMQRLLHQRQPEAESAVHPVHPNGTVSANTTLQRREGPDGTVTTAVGNPLVGLKRGDGLNFGTFEQRPRVRMLQEKLNEKMLGGLNIDGMFGVQTERLLKDFQLSIGVVPQAMVDPVTGDALMGKKKQEIPPVEELPTSNMELEDLMDAIWLQYQIMLKNQNDALNRLENDLQSQEQESNIGAAILEKLGIKVLDLLLFGQGATLRSFISGFIRDDEDLSQEEKDDLIKTAVDPIFELAKSPSEDKLKEVVKESTAVKMPSLDTFIESQRSAVTEASDSAQETFLVKTKAELRKKPPDGQTANGQPGEDRRLAKARKLLKAVRSQKLRAFRSQYDESLAKWAIAQAQGKLGLTPGKAFAEQTGTDMSKGQKGVPGVVELEIDGSSPNKPVKIEGAKIIGLSEVTRNRLKNKTIGQTGLPVLASGKVNEGFLGIKLFNASITIAQNELADVFEAGSSDGGKKWLREKAAIDLGNLPDLPVKPSEEEGANVIFRDDINKKKISDIPGGLKGP